MMEEYDVMTKRLMNIKESSAYIGIAPAFQIPPSRS
jgi:hypothetical protein